MVVPNDEQLVVRAVRTSQGGDTYVYAFFAPGGKITQIADISRVHRATDGKLEGFQRREIRDHVHQIVDYLNRDTVLFPNAIILALYAGVEFKLARGRDPDGLAAGQIGTLFIPIRETGKCAAWIVDGQQRSLALSRTQHQDIMVPIIAFETNSLEVQREQFILINKARPLPTRLINELLPEVDTLLPTDLAVRKLPSELCSLLNRDPGSPFYKRIRQLSSGSSEQAVISDTAVVGMIKRSINDPLGALAQFKAVGGGESDLHGMYQALVLFWSAVAKVFTKEWALPPTESRLTHSAGIHAMGVLMDRILVRHLGENHPAENIQRSLNRLASACHWTSGKWKDIDMEWDEIQSVSRHIKLLTEQLIKLDYHSNLRGNL